MKLSYLPLLCLLSAAPPAVHAGTFVGIGINLGPPRPIVVERPPPPVYREVAVPAPGPGYVWVGGHYTWRHRRWIWIPGHWYVPPQPGAYWVAGHFDGYNRWIEGHWEVAAVPPPPPAAPAEVVVASPPPPPQPDVYVAAPGPGFVWIGGYWGWDGYRHVWYRGHWEHPPHGCRAWAAPRWENRNGVHVFIRGYWH